MATSLTPIGTADQNSDAVRQSNAAAWFNSFEGILTGIDDAPRVTPASRGETVLGYGSSLGVDIGIGNNGEFYARGRVGQVGSDSDTSSTTSGQAAAPRFRVTPAMMLIAIAAFLLLRK